jgi:hypothetical protein
MDSLMHAKHSKVTRITHKIPMPREVLAFLRSCSLASAARTLAAIFAISLVYAPFLGLGAAVITVGGIFASDAAAMFTLFESVSAAGAVAMFILVGSVSAASAYFIVAV